MSEIAERDDILRVTDWSSFIGQQGMKNRLDIHIEAANTEGRILDHILLEGHPGMGKTSLAAIIAARLGEQFQLVRWPVTTQILGQVLDDFDSGGGVLLIDEIHRGTSSQQEELLTLLEMGFVQTRTSRRFHTASTIIGATTEADKVIPTLRDRFPIQPYFEEYSDDEMAQIIIGMADKVFLEVDPEAAKMLGKATGGTPRKARQFVLALRDMSATGNSTTVEDVLNFCGVDHDGLTRTHIEYLKILDQLGGQAGLETLSSMLRLHGTVLKDLERLMLKQQLMTYGPRGRMLLPAGRRKARGKHK